MVLNAAVKNAIFSSNFDRRITDHKVINVDLDVGLRHSGSLVEDITDASSIHVETVVANLK